MDNRPALAGLSVLDLTSDHSGAVLSGLLTWSGADCVRVDDVTHSDRFLAEATEWADLSFRGGQRSSSPAELATLLPSADVVLLNDTPTRSLPAGVEVAQAVVVCLTPFGLSGPYSPYVGSSIVATALGGQLAPMGDSALPPLAHGLDIPGVFAALNAWVAVLAALDYRRLTGRGDVLDVSIHESMAANAEYNEALYWTQGAVRGRWKARHPMSFPSGVYPCADGFVVVSAGSDRFWDLIGRPDLREDPRFTSSASRIRNWELVDSVVTKALATRTVDELVTSAIEFRVALAPVNSLKRLLQDPQLTVRGFFTPGQDGKLVAGPPARLSRTPLKPHLESDPHEATATVQSATHPDAVGRPLEGVLVLDCSHVYAGPMCGRLLADLGARVIKVEDIRNWDRVRIMVPVMDTPTDRYWELGTMFSQRNLGKEGLTLDLKSFKGRRVLLKLVEKADVLLQSFTPRVFEAFGLGWDVLNQANPRLVMASLSGYGQDGPLANLGAYGAGIEGAAGITIHTGYEGGPPVSGSNSYLDPLNGIVAAGAVLTALAARNRDGHGQFIDVSEQEAGILVSRPLLEKFIATGEARQRLGNASPAFAAQGCYPCSGDDQWVALTCTLERVASLCAIVGAPHLAGRADLQTLAGCFESRAEIDVAISEWSVGISKADATRDLQEAGIAAGGVLDGREMLLDRHLEARGHYDVVDHPVVGPRPYGKHLPVKSLNWDSSPRGPAPLLGQDNRRILAEVGLSADEISALEDDGVIGTDAIPAMTWDAFRTMIGLPYETLLETAGLREIDANYRRILHQRFPDIPEILPG